MAVYDFKCDMCDHVETDVVLPMTHEKSERPKHCGRFMEYHITTPPTVHWKDYDVCYKPVSVKDAPPITSRKQEREFMKKHDLVHADFTPPSHAEEQQTRAEIQKSIEGITAPDKATREYLKRLDIV